MGKKTDETIFDTLIEREFKTIAAQLDAKRIITTAKNKPRALEKTIQEILSGTKEEVTNGQSDSETEN